jgi:hypothetical protein
MPSRFELLDAASREQEKAALDAMAREMGEDADADPTQVASQATSTYRIVVTARINNRNKGNRVVCSSVDGGVRYQTI